MWLPCDLKVLLMAIRTKCIPMQVQMASLHTFAFYSENTVMRNSTMTRTAATQLLCRDAISFRRHKDMQALCNQQAHIVQADGKTGRMAEHLRAQRCGAVCQSTLHLVFAIRCGTPGGPS